jgi:hypothetical protein
MALLVNDTNDPSGGGMFSKPGRFTSEKYIVFQKKDEIMANQRKFYKITSVLNLNFVSLIRSIRTNRILLRTKIKSPKKMTLTGSILLQMLSHDH